MRLRALGSRAALAVGMADVASLAAVSGAWPHAARLFAKSEALLRDEGAALSWPAREHYTRAREEAWHALGAAAPAAVAAGEALTLEATLSEAGAVLEHHRPTDRSAQG